MVIKSLSGAIHRYDFVNVIAISISGLSSATTLLLNNARAIVIIQVCGRAAGSIGHLGNAAAQSIVEVLADDGGVCHALDLSKTVFLVISIVVSGVLLEVSVAVV